MSKMGVDLIFEDIEKETKENVFHDSEKKLNDFINSLSENEKTKLKEKLFEETEENEENEENEESEESEE